ncbi:MAG: hypothetical protein ACKOAD_05795 [Gammaproteobacteria bacterium]
MPRFHWLSFFLFIGILFYASAVKFQAVYLSPILFFWLFKRRFLTAILVSALFIGSVFQFNALVSSPSNSWQFVKLFDLTGISLQEKENLIPSFAQGPSFSMQHLEKFYSPRRVDDLVFVPQPTLKTTHNREELQALQNLWWDAVLKYPASYFKHRFAIFYTQLNTSPLKPLNSISDQQMIQGPTLKIIKLLDHLGIYTFFSELSKFIWYLPLSIIYLLISARLLNKPQYSNLASPVFFMNLSGLSLIAILFVFSMAAEARYIYLAQCCVHFSHPLMLILLFNKKSNSKIPPYLF